MAATDLQDRTHFGPYRVVRRIGCGGMGSIFEAEDTGLGHRVALKLLHPHVAGRPGAAERFLREGRAAARIRHPHIVQVFALGTEGGTPYLAMELLDGEDLSQLIARKSRLPADEALDLVLPVVAAVAAAHDAGVIHRDLKPSNICTMRGHGTRPWPKVVDFGVSKVIAGDAANEVTGTDIVIGTAAYMAPEQARAACNASFRSDQYSLAVLLYECVTGAPPFSGRSVYEVLQSIMTAPLVVPSALVTGIPSALDRAVLRAMSRDPNDRFASVRAFGAAMLPFASERTRLALNAELHDRAAAESDDSVAKHVDTSCLGTWAATPLGHTTAPPTESSNAHGGLPRFEGVRWVGIAALGAFALIVTNLAVRPPAERMSVAVATPRAANLASVVSDPPPNSVTGTGGAIPAFAGAQSRQADQAVVMQRAAASVSAWRPAGSRHASPAPPAASALVRKSALEYSAPAASASALPIGDNGAPILP
jgi:serine/threonine-protein kinase